MKAFLALGYDESTFWTLTPRKYYLYKDAAIMRHEMETERLVTAAWIGGVTSQSSEIKPLNEWLDMVIPSRAIAIQKQEEDENQFIQALIIYSRQLPKVEL